MENIAKTLMVTTECGGGCAHCPFSDVRMIKKHLSPSDAYKVVQQSKAPLLVISGGEPFEYKYIDDLLDLLKNEAKKYRIATGGHIAFDQYLDRLRAQRGFEGISLGTDVISNRSNRTSQLRQIWKANVTDLNKKRIPYSLTFTFKPDLMFFEGLIRLSKEFGAEPQFIYLRIAKANFTDEISGALSATYPSIPILIDELQ